MTNLLLHLGYPKTGTTFLQKTIFEAHPDIACIGRPSRDYKRGWFRGQVLAASDKEFEKNLGHVRHVLEREIGERLQTRAVLSDESFSTGRLAETCWTVTPIEALERLHKISPENTNVLITIRNQYNLTVSLYNHFVRMNLTNLSFEKWIEKHKYCSGESVLSAFRFSPFISTAHRLFGTNHTTVLFYEDLRGSPRRFMDSLSSVLSLSGHGLNCERNTEKVNAITRSEARYLAFRRQLPTWITKRFLHVRRRVGLKPGSIQRWIGTLDTRYAQSTDQMTPDVCKWIETFYGSDNRELDRILSGQLTARSYPGTAPPVDAHKASQRTSMSVGCASSRTNA